MLDTLGGVGYYANGTDMGVSFCLAGMSDEISTHLLEWQGLRDKLFNRMIERLKGGELKTTKHLQWFNLSDTFKPMGVKMVGVFCNTIKNMDFLDHSKYLAGFQILPNKIPGFGEIEFNQSKISMRVSNELEEKIRANQIPGLSTFLAEATENLDGFVDACHEIAAATTIDIGKEEELILEMEAVLEKH